MHWNKINYEGVPSPGANLKGNIKHQIKINRREPNEKYKTASEEECITI